MLLKLVVGALVLPTVLGMNAGGGDHENQDEDANLANPSQSQRTFAEILRAMLHESEQRKPHTHDPQARVYSQKEILDQMTSALQKAYEHEELQEAEIQSAQLRSFKPQHNDDEKESDPGLVAAAAKRRLAMQAMRIMTDIMADRSRISKPIPKSSRQFNFLQEDNGRFDISEDNKIATHNLSGGTARMEWFNPLSSPVAEVTVQWIDGSDFALGMVVDGFKGWNEHMGKYILRNEDGYRVVKAWCLTNFGQIESQNRVVESSTKCQRAPLQKGDAVTIRLECIDGTTQYRRGKQWHRLSWSRGGVMLGALELELPQTSTSRGNDGFLRIAFAVHLGSDASVKILNPKEAQLQLEEARRKAKLDAEEARRKAELDEARRKAELEAEKARQAELADTGNKGGHSYVEEVN